MGITSGSASFRGDVPTLEAIVAKVEELSGLPLVVESRPQETMWRFNANIAFACVRRERLDVYAYAPGDWIGRLRNTAPPTNPDVNLINTRGYISEEGTLHDFVLVALESLGGVLAKPMSGERRARCAAPLTPARLKTRHRQHARLWISELLKAPIRLLMTASRRSSRRR